ncbi:CoA pyrophosphatase [Pseudorhodoferax sp. Leaf267]|uniref:NUDIX hydrolase n=1 Tax=Pseudorhodoferax sp. Leaf267 TaxID=1736316 RepID=UPI0006FE534E|nr:CoA pyrophosphatase [Pseudorhodoferax sp. Leaf267]KQP17877.1 NUDIX hydrolase [Pseudorhodoferax sp. Leaf267]
MQLDAPLRQRVQDRLQTFALQTTPCAGHRAAVALTLLEEGWGADLAGLAKPTAWSSAAAVLLTRRALTLRNHPGQWSLPGGRIEPGESAAEAALRELHEEVGLRLDGSAVLGLLDDFVTRSGFVITPVVVWAGPARATLVADPAEVASIHRVRVQEFMREDAPLLEPIADSPHPVLRMPMGDGWVAAPTAALLYQFREVCIAGRTTRVAHFEQPLFARK